MKCKRLIENDFPLARINQSCAHENNIKSQISSGHLSLLHTWWARRPSASCRSVLLGLLLPDPCDPACPKEFKIEAWNIIGWESLQNSEKSDLELREALKDFISRFSKWEMSSNPDFISKARGLIQAAFPSGAPVVADPFAGGGSIPLEAARLGCDVFASELNPVAWLLLKITLDWSVLFGADLTRLFETWSTWVLKECQKRLAPFYSIDKRGSSPLSFFWARTVQCEAPGCGVTVPLIRNLWLSNTKSSERALEIRYKEKSKIPVISVFQPRKNSDVKAGTVDGMNAHCPKCDKTTPKERVQAQLLKNSGGAKNSILIAIASEKVAGRGKEYRSVTEEDILTAHKAEIESKRVSLELPASPPSGDTGFRARPYGITNWADVFTPRQKLSRWIVHEIIEEALLKAKGDGIKDDLLTALASCLYVAYSDNSQYHTSLCVCLSQGVKSIFIQGSGVPMRSDFVEGNPLSTNCEGLSYSIRSMQSALHGLNSFSRRPSEPVLASALDPVLPDASVDVIFTDPPYYNSIPYAYLSDFFYGLLRLGLKSRLPKEFSASETDKKGEITKNLEVTNGTGVHDAAWYENNMARALSRARDALVDDGIGSVVFAHKRY